MQTQRLKTQINTQVRIVFITILMLTGGLFSLKAWGQSDRGSITGTVVDPTGAAVVGVEVSIAGSLTGTSYPGATTNENGFYRIINLPIGHYWLSFKKEGFKLYDRKGITVSVAQDVKLDVKLQVGGNTESITVTADAEMLNSTIATEATTLDA